jgi:hypothetical protein
LEPLLTHWLRSKSALEAVFLVQKRKKKKRKRKRKRVAATPQTPT